MEEVEKSTADVIAALLAENDALRAALAEHGYVELSKTKASGLVLAEPEVRPGAPITLTYTNWRGDTEVRRIIPRRVWWGSTEWHPEPQWLLTAFDVDKQAERDFALKDFGQPAQPLTVQDAAQVPEIAALIEALSQQNSWLKAALGCQAWMWDADQRELAEQDLTGGEAALRAIAEGK